MRTSADPLDRDSIDPVDMLDEIGAVIHAHSSRFLKLLPAGATVRRGRCHGTDGVFFADAARCADPGHTNRDTLLILQPDTAATTTRPT